jgi:hypothetical protein
MPGAPEMGWQRLAHQGNFTIIRLQGPDAHRRFSAYVGPQSLNRAWTDGGGGAQRITTLQERWPMTPAEGTEPLDGVAPQTVSFTLVMESDGSQGRRVLRTMRRALDMKVTAVRVNGAQFLLRTFTLDMMTEDADGSARTLSRLDYVPSLGAAVRGEILLPTIARWQFEDIRVSARVQEELAMVALR